LTVTEPGYAELDPRFVPQQKFTGRLRALAIAAASLAVLMVLLRAGDDGSAWRRPVLVATWMIAVALIVWHAEAWPAREFAHTRYQLSPDGLQIAHGVLWRTVTHVPRSRVQHTDVSQGPVERRYGLGTLVVYTAGTDHARVSLPGLAWETALALRDELRLDRSDDHV
jgi:membrane protein YdbS with pleckstrin-like domain